jgi:hypothetical protein
MVPAEERFAAMSHEEWYELVLELVGRRQMIQANEPHEPEG